VFGGFRAADPDAGKRECRTKQQARPGHREQQVCHAAVSSSTVSLKSRLDGWLTVSLVVMWLTQKGGYLLDGHGERSANLHPRVASPVNSSMIGRTRACQLARRCTTATTPITTITPRSTAGGSRLPMRAPRNPPTIELVASTATTGQLTGATNA
jgi:hypothetical protein